MVLRQTSVVAGLLSMAVLTAPAWGWGREGHQAVCEIAFLELGPMARQAVKDLIRDDDRYRTFRLACTWPDTEGTLQDQRRPEHYVNVPRDWSSIPAENCPLARRCLFTALRRDAGTLGSTRAGVRERMLALRSLGHWVADLHQPFHVSYRDDRGGSRIRVTGDLDCPDNLHAFWDTCLPRQLMQQLGVSTPRDLGAKLQTRITSDQRETWLRAGTFALWADESLAIVREVDTGYCWVREGDCLPRTGSGVYLTPAYRERHVDLVATRLQQAGVRLGALLDTLLGER